MMQKSKPSTNESFLRGCVYKEARMKAVVYKGPKKVKVEEVEDAKIQAPTDALLKVTSTAICGSDLHMYEGRSVAKPGTMFGHEIMGVIEEAGSALFLDKERGPGGIAVQYRLRRLLQLRAGISECLSHCQSRCADCGVRVCGHGTVPRRPGRVCARALCGLQLSEASRAPLMTSGKMISCSWQIFSPQGSIPRKWSGSPRAPRWEFSGPDRWVFSQPTARSCRARPRSTSWISIRTGWRRQSRSARYRSISPKATRSNRS